MSECIGKDCNSEECKAVEPEIVEQPKAEDKPRPRMQYVFITLADGRRGVFAGPELITKTELLLKPPVLVDLVFSEPKGIEEPKNVTEDKKAEIPPTTPA